MRLQDVLWIVAMLAGGGVVGQTGCEDFGTVVSAVRIGTGAGGFDGELDPGDGFGTSVSRLGDLDGDGVDEIAVGAPFDDDGAENAGAIWILFMNVDGTVRASQKLSAVQGGLVGQLDAGGWFGASVAGVGDVDGDGTPDMATAYDGEVWILFLTPAGTVRQVHQILAGDVEGFGGFGGTVAAVGDVNDDRIPDLAVGGLPGQAWWSCWVLLLDQQGHVQSDSWIYGEDYVGFRELNEGGATWGDIVSGVGDLDKDGIVDLAIAARNYRGDSGPDERGALWLALLQPTGDPRSVNRIDEPALRRGDQFGSAIAVIGDINGDGADDLVVGARGDDDGGADAGGMWLVLMSETGAVLSTRKVEWAPGGGGGPLVANGRLGSTLAVIEPDSATGRPRVVAGVASGEVFVLTMSRCFPSPVVVANPASVLLPGTGGVVVMEVEAIGTDPLTYQWYRDGIALPESAIVLGADSPTLTVFATEAEEGLYTCVVSNAYGSVTSDPAVLGVRAAPPTADINGDGRRDIFDVIAFFELFTE